MKHIRETMLAKELSFEQNEAYIRMRTNFLYTTLNGAYKKIVFTSCESGEGKTTTVLNLAITLAKAGKKVLLLDCDMRKSVMRHYLQAGSLPRRGLSEILSNLERAEDCIVRQEEYGFDLIFSGATAPNPSELLASENMKHLLEQLAPRYDYLLMDAPPVLSVSDPAILSAQCDGVIFVVRHEKIKKKQLLFALNALRNVGAKLLGTVLEQYDPKHDHSIGLSGGRYYYKYYYGESK